MMKKKNLFYVGTFVLTTLAISMALTSRNTMSNYAASGTSGTLTLNNSTATGATASYNDGSFNISTALGNTVGWEYKYAKASNSGLIVLGNQSYENPDCSNYYIGNTDPITSVTGITVNFTEDTKLFFFGSYDGVTYYKLEVVTASKTLTIGNSYFYFRFVNANSYNIPIDISSIVINYGCVSSDYTDELSDLTSATRINAGELAASAISEDDSIYSNHLNSNKSIKITAPITDHADDSANMYLYSFSFALPRSYTIGELKKMYVSFETNTENNSAFDGDHNFWRLYIYFSTSGYSQIKNAISKSVEAKSGNMNNGVSGWQSETVILSTASYIGDLDENTSVSYLYFRPAYVNGYVNIDQMRIGFIDNYPDYEIPAAWIQSNSLTLTSENNVGNKDNKVTCTNITGTTHGDGIRATATGDVAQYSRIFSIVLDDKYNLPLSQTAGGSIEFWFNFGGATSTSTTKLISLQLVDTGTGEAYRASDEVRTDNAAITLDNSDIANNWVKITIDLSKLGTLTSHTFDRVSIKTTTSSYLSFNTNEYFEFTSFAYSNLVINQ